MRIGGHTRRYTEKMCKINPLKYSAVCAVYLWLSNYVILIGHCMQHPAVTLQFAEINITLSLFTNLMKHKKVVCGKHVAPVPFNHCSFVPPKLLKIVMWP
jgi:hypothetical protein